MCPVKVSARYERWCSALRVLSFPFISSSLSICAVPARFPSLYAYDALRPAHRVFADVALANVDTKFEQLA
jgi:hypothetical protein